MAVGGRWASLFLVPGEAVSSAWAGRYSPPEMRLEVAQPAPSEWTLFQFCPHPLPPLPLPRRRRPLQDLWALPPPTLRVSCILPQPPSPPRQCARQPPAGPAVQPAWTHFPRRARQALVSCPCCPGMAEQRALSPHSPPLPASARSSPTLNAASAGVLVRLTSLG